MPEVTLVLFTIEDDVPNADFNEWLQTADDHVDFTIISESDSKEELQNEQILEVHSLLRIELHTPPDDATKLAKQIAKVYWPPPVLSADEPGTDVLTALVGDADKLVAAANEARDYFEWVDSFGPHSTHTPPDDATIAEDRAVLLEQLVLRLYPDRRHDLAWHEMDEDENDG